MISPADNQPAAALGEFDTKNSADRGSTPRTSTKHGLWTTTIGALFGITRGLTTILVGKVKVTEDLQDLHRTLEGTQHPARRFSGAAAAAVAAALVM